jgi:uncharacterized protein YndB with AHSA1/START domain
MQFRPDSFGEIDVRGDTTIITFHRRIDHPIDDVWRAITREDELMRWWGDATIDLRQRVFFVRALNADSDGEHQEMHALVTEVTPPTLLQLDGDLHGRLRFELEPDGEQTSLTFTTCLGLPDEQQTLNMASWHFHLDALGRALDGEANDLVDLTPTFPPIHNRYLQRSVNSR